METATVAPARNLPGPLLPAPLLGPSSHLWLWVLPLVILGLLNLQGYALVGSEMDDEQRSWAQLLGLAGITNLALGIAVFVFTRFFRRDRAAHDAAQPLWGLPGLLSQVAYLWLAVSTLEAGMLPRNITAWIYPENRFLFNQFAFCMLPAFHGILRLAAARPSASTGKTLVVSLGLTIGGPIALYVLLLVAASFGLGGGGQWPGYFFAVLVIVAGVVMFLGVVRALLVALRRAQAWHETGERWAVVLFALIMPMAGLSLNIAIPFPVDFQALEVYVLTGANALVMLFAAWRSAVRPRLSWHLLCGSLPFALYFFVVFLPFTPLSVLAVIAMGAGLLVLTPTLLFALHVHLLASAWRRAVATTTPRRLLAGGTLAVLALPMFFTARGLADKAALNAALAHLYEPTVPRGDIAFGSSLANLRRAVDSHRDYKDGLYYPLLSDYYSWLVFDNLVLPDPKLAEIERVFFGVTPGDAAIDPFRKDRGLWGRGRAADQLRVRRPPPPPQTVEVDARPVRAVAAGPASTTLTAAMTLRNTGPVDAEYVRTLTLPAGVFVSGFRLQVGDTLVPGRIFEKKAALWVYSMIRDTERRDPGLLYYQTADRLELRVFPIIAGKPVVVEIDLLVPASISAAQFGEGTVSLDTLLATTARLRQPVWRSNLWGQQVVAGLDERKLPAVPQVPYLHVIIDRSAQNGFQADLAGAWPALRALFPAARQVRLVAANYEVITLEAALLDIARPPTPSSRDLERVMPLSGGLAFDLALAHALRMHRDRELDGSADAPGIPPRPVVVILSRQAAARPGALPLTEAWADLAPALEVCELGEDGSFVTHRPAKAASGPLLRAGSSVRPLAAGRLLRFSSGDRDPVPQFWEPTAGEWRNVGTASQPEPDDRWAGAATLELQQQDLDREPGGVGLDRRGLLAAARASGILVASGSYIVVENQAQWRMLEISEQRKLDQNQALDFVETPAPPMLWIILAFAALQGGRVWLNRRRTAAVQA